MRHSLLSIQWGLMCFLFLAQCGYKNKTATSAFLDDASSARVWVAIGRDPSPRDNVYTIFFAAPLAASKLSVCADASVDQCTAGTAQTINTSSIPASASNVTFFKTVDQQEISNGKVFALVARDASGTVVASSRIRFSQKNQSSNLPADKDLALTGEKNTKKKLSELFEGKYLLVELSGAHCGPCVQLAHDVESDQSMQSAFSSKKCSIVTIVDSLGEWLQNFNAGSSTRHHSFANDGGLGAAASKFGINLEYTPTVFMIDQSGKVVTKAAPEIPQEFKTLCQ